MLDPDAEYQSRRELVLELHRLEESVEVAAQSQFEHAKIWRVLHYVLGSLAAGLAAIAGGVGVSAIGADQLTEAWSAPVAAALALFSAVATALVTALKPAETYSRATQVGNEYLDLQSHARTFRNIDLPVISIDDARLQLQTIMERRHTINKSANPPFRFAYRRAISNIESGSTEYAVDRE